MSKVTTTAILPCYIYASGKLTILDHERYRALKRRNRIIKKALEDSNQRNRKGGQ